VTKVGKSDCEGTFAGASGNDEGAPIVVIHVDRNRLIWPAGDLVYLEKRGMLSWPHPGRPNRMRRLLIILFALAGALPVPSGAQTHTARVAVLTPYPNQSAASGWRAFTDVLGERGWVEGRNIAFDIRETEGRPELFQRFAAELVASRPDLVIGVTTQGTQAVRQQTDTIPIVMCSVGDPVAAGFVESLARPGGNITGPSAQLDDIQEKSLQLLKEARPSIVRVALLWTPDNAGSRHSKEILVVLAPRLGITLEPIPINTPEDIDSALAAIERNRPDALFVHPTPVLQVHDQKVIAFALKQRLPTITGISPMVRDGILLSYASDPIQGWRVTADYVDRILRGAKPADLPVQQPTKFELVVNLQTAKALGLTVPPSILALADEVIE
jgi:putative ABC transport system substrate-binding protein